MFSSTGVMYLKLCLMWMFSRQQHGILSNGVHFYVLTEFRCRYVLCDTVGYNFNSHLLVLERRLKDTNYYGCRGTKYINVQQLNLIPTWTSLVDNHQLL